MNKPTLYKNITTFQAFYIRVAQLNFYLSRYCLEECPTQLISIASIIFTSSCPPPTHFVWGVVKPVVSNRVSLSMYLRFFHLSLMIKY